MSLAEYKEKPEGSAPWESRGNPWWYRNTAANDLCFLAAAFFHHLFFSLQMKEGTNVSLRIAFSSLLPFVLFLVLGNGGHERDFGWNTGKE